jgi:probable F420-dependent oxidoreductase
MCYGCARPASILRRIVLSTPAPAAGPAAPDLDPVVDDWSGWLISGRVRSNSEGSPYETTIRTPRQGIEDGIDAERIGYRRVYLSERLNLKHAGAFLGGVAALTSRLEVGPAMATPGYHHPLEAAAFGATMHACYGPRFVLGVGRGSGEWLKGTGMAEAGYQAAIDYANIVRRLWRGETVDYEGPLGTFKGLELGDVYEGPAPEIWFGGFGHPKFAATAAEAFDAVFLHPFYTPEAVHGAVTRLREACERVDRDPASLRIVQPVVTAPELDDYETRALCHARAVTYFQIAGYGESLVRANGWDRKILDDIRNHPQVTNHEVMADFRFHRVELMKVAERVPDELIEASCAMGSVDECLKFVQALKEAGADEIATYGSTPRQNARLVAAWREAKQSSVIAA